MELGLAGKSVLVVGASKGMGRSAAVGFAKEGSKVTVVARDEELLKTLVEEMGGEAAGHSYLVADLMKDGEPTAIAKHLLDTHGPFNVVVHAVGGPLEIRNPTAPLSDWRMVWQFNCGIAIEMNEFLIPPMVEAGWGRVILLSSASARTLRGACAYASSKAYVNAYVTTAGRLLAPSGVVMSAVCPGAVSFEGSYWDIQIKDKNPRVDDFLRHHQAILRMGSPEEVTPFILLMGSELASFANAALIPVDGGNM